jgi:RimJ/RimL family protein N-acetyltransferase
MSKIAHIPVLETERLVLRGYRLGDFPAFAAMRADPVVMRFIGNEQPRLEEESWASFTGIVGHWQLMGYGTWAVEEKATRALIGSAGFAEKKRPSEHPAGGAPEMGWSLARAAHGRGYATEAVHAALAWGRAHLGPRRTVCVINVENTASIRVAEKCGFRRFAQAERYGKPRLVCERML